MSSSSRRSWEARWPSLWQDTDEDSALGEGSKRPRKGHSYEAPSSPPVSHQADNPQARFGEDIDDHDSETNAAGSHLDRNTTTSFASRATYTSMPMNLAGPLQAAQHLFTNASNFSIGQFNSYVFNQAGDQQVQVLVQVLQAELARRSISQAVGYNQENGVTITDPLGGRLVLPPSIMRQYSDVHGLMLKHFHGKLGEERVIENRYCIVTERNGALVQPENWDRVLNSGEGLIVCMLVKKVWVESVKDTCPQCGKTTLGTYQEGGWLICRRCEKRFRSSVDSISMFRRPPPHDDKIASFRHIRKVFVERSHDYDDYGSPRYRLRRYDDYFNWDDARREEESLFEGEVLIPPEQFHLESRYHSSSDNESDYGSSWSSKDEDP